MLPKQQGSTECGEQKQTLSGKLTPAVGDGASSHTPLVSAVGYGTEGGKYRKTRKSVGEVRLLTCRHTVIDTYRQQIQMCRRKSVEKHAIIHV